MEETIRVNIKRYREAQGMTQKELGVALGFKEEHAQQRISQYEMDPEIKEFRSPNKKTLQQMAIVLKQPVEAFMMDNYEDRMLELMKKVIRQSKKDIA